MRISFMGSEKYLRKDGTEDTTNHYISIDSHIFLGASGDMFRIKGLVESTAFNAMCEFGDSGGDVVIDVEGHRSVRHCLIPKSQLKPVF